MLDNYIDKDRRKCNVIIYNFPEEISDSEVERTEKNILRFRELVKEELCLYFMFFLKI